MTAWNEVTSERISGDVVRTVATHNDFSPTWIAVDASWLVRLAAQVDRDADLAARLAAAERERDEWRRKYQNVDAAYSSVYGTEAELKALRADAEQWRAFHAVIGHERRMMGGPVWVSVGLAGDVLWVTDANTKNAKYERVSAPTITDLRDSLDALAEAAKPKPETWRWRFKDGTLSESVSTPEDLRHLGHSFDGTPVREVRNPAGDVLLLREGRPVPEGFQ